MRSCSSCSECCYTLGVHEIGKSDFTRCPHDKPSKQGCCSIYKTKPASCASFSCLWLAGHLERKDRPDRIGIVFATADILPGQPVIMAYVRKPDADKSGRGKELLDLLSQLYPVCVVRWNRTKTIMCPESMRHYIPTLDREMMVQGQLVDGEWRRVVQLPVVGGRG